MCTEGNDPTSRSGSVSRRRGRSESCTIVGGGKGRIPNEGRGGSEGAQPPPPAGNEVNPSARGKVGEGSKDSVALVDIPQFAIFAAATAAPVRAAADANGIGGAGPLWYSAPQTRLVADQDPRARPSGWVASADVES